MVPAAVSPENLIRQLAFEMNSDLLIQQVSSGEEGHSSHMTEHVYGQELWVIMSHDRACTWAGVADDNDKFGANLRLGSFTTSLK